MVKPDPQHCNPENTACRRQGSYALRDRIERFFNGAKNSRRVATRYDKLIESFAAFVLLALIRIWISCPRDLMSRKIGRESLFGVRVRPIVYLCDLQDVFFATSPSQHSPDAREDFSALRIQHHHLGDDVLRIAQLLLVDPIRILYREVIGRLVDLLRIHCP